jgi:hypothetical protein
MLDLGGAFADLLIALDEMNETGAKEKIIEITLKNGRKLVLKIEVQDKPLLVLVKCSGDPS